MSAGRLTWSCVLSRPGVRANAAQFPASASRPSRILTPAACHTTRQPGTPEPGPLTITIYGRY